MTMPLPAMLPFPALRIVLAVVAVPILAFKLMLPDVVITEMLGDCTIPVTLMVLPPVRLKEPPTFEAARLLGAVPFIATLTFPVAPVLANARVSAFVFVRSITPVPELRVKVFAVTVPDEFVMSPLLVVRVIFDLLPAAPSPPKMVISDPAPVVFKLIVLAMLPVSVCIGPLLVI